MLFYFKTEGRFYFNHSNVDELLMRPALAYNVSKKLSVWIGYDFFQSIHNSERINQAFWGQAQIKMIDSNSINLVSRTRLENRLSTLGQGQAIRLRERGFVELKLFPKIKPRPILYDEIFLNLNHPDWVSKKTISQNRVFLGIKISLSKTTDLIIGYLSRTQYNTEETIKENLANVMFEVSFD
ncbi:DUF2490 domain-containing protein [Legionella oakridgensis]|uniref:DUF2490 domain-containing protein n=1 Tax=Legionella oakridgensis TaxID=29423 RepID=UPI0009E012B3|nr:DUF2490 domain-containing protein [Legionella oakridgensis]